MRILAVYSETLSGRWGWLRLRRSQIGIWHAIAERTPLPTVTICGGPITSEAFRTWEQAPLDALCPECERAITAASGSSEIDVPGRHHSRPSSDGNLVRRRQH